MQILYMKYSKSNIRALVTLWLFAFCFNACSQHPPDSETGLTADEKAAAKDAFARLNEGGSSMEEDFTGVKTDASGAVGMETISGSSVEEMIDYRTGEPGWVEVEETRNFSNSVSPDRAKQELLQILRNKAVSKKVPPNVEVSQLLTDVMSESEGSASEQTAWSGFFKHTVSGVITAEEILIDKLQPVEDGYKKTIRIKAYVEPVRGQRDAGFYIDVALENNLLKAGDELAFSVTPSKDCYLYVFNLMADQNIMLMLPNEYFEDNFIKGGTTMQIPDPVIRKYRKFRVAPMPGEDLTSESVYIVCTKEEVPAIRDLPQIGTAIQVFSGKSQDFVKLQRWLTNIPLNQRVEKNLIYHVSKN